MKWRSLFGILCLSCGLSSTLWAWGRTEWQGVEAYRSKHYKKAAKVFSQIDSPWAWYNEANARAHLGQYEQSLKLYDRVLQADPKQQDALYNREIVRKLLQKSEAEKKAKSASGKSSSKSEQQNKSQQDQSQQDKAQQESKADSAPADQTKSSESNSDPNDQKKESESKTTPSDQKHDSAPKSAGSHQKKADQAEADKKSAKPEQQDKSPKNATPSTELEHKIEENEEAKKQWLKIIPDDPGGLLRKQFYRDHLRRQEGTP